VKPYNARWNVSRQTNVVVVGAGYAGLMAAMRLAKKTDASVAITLINAAETFHERVRNHQLAAGQPMRQHALTSLLQGTRIRFLKGVVTELQPSQRRMTVQTDEGIQSVGYDYLVYAQGSFISTDGVPGAQRYAYTLNQASAMALAGQLPAVAAHGGQLLIVGGGNTGVELATELAETYPGLRITLATRRSFARNLSPAARAHIRRAFDGLDIQFVENTAINRVDEHRALTEQGEAIPFEVCVWVGGFAVSDLARQAGLRVNERGQILIDRAMRSPSHPEIYAVGDAAFPAEDPGAPIHMSLYTAIMMGGHGADCLSAQLNGKAPTAFGLSYVALGVSLGRRDGVVQFLDWSRDTPLNLIVTGKLANLTREFFVRFALGVIKAQRVAPWVFDWPGKRKMRRLTVDAARPTAPVAVGPSAMRAER
jgi:NADH dehydrogenase FAD-containing subunit